MDVAHLAETGASSVFVFNPFTEGWIASAAFTPVKHQVLLAGDLSNLPQFLCRDQDIVLVPRRPSASLTETLKRAGFAEPRFVLLNRGHINSAAVLGGRKLGSLRPWAWGPDSLRLFKPLFKHLSNEWTDPNRYFNKSIARLYSKAWSADFLKKVVAAWAEPWLCTENEVGLAAGNSEDVLKRIAAIRALGHHRVVVKEALGLAGHNALRLWEPEILPNQLQWMASVLREGRRLVVEPWLDRLMDFSVQLEMGQGGLALCGYTGLINDLRGQYQANWVEPQYQQSLPAQVVELFRASTANSSDALQQFFCRMFSMLESELAEAGYVGPISIDAFVYRTTAGQARLKPVVEINPRYTMGRLALELMMHACPGSHGLFRLVSRSQASVEGFTDFSSYAQSLCQRAPLNIVTQPTTRIQNGALCLNEPEQAQACLATFRVSPGPLHRPDWNSD